MSWMVDVMLAVGVGTVWLAAAAFLRLRPMARIHAVSFVNVVGGGAVTLAAWLSEGVSPRTGKILLIWLVLLFAGAISAHVTGRAIHLRTGDRQ